MTETVSYSPLVEVRKELRPATPQETALYSRTNFSKAQINWMKDRDNNRCLLTDIGIRHDCTGILNEHHILAQSYMQLGLHLTPDMINIPENGATLCSNIHTGAETPLNQEPDPNMLHPDHFQARRDYAVDQHSFQDLAKKNRELAMRKIKAWNTENDDLIRSHVIYRTKRKERMEQNPYPAPPVPRK